MQPTRIQLRLADGLGLSQAVRSAAEELARTAGDDKVAGRATGIARAAASWQERLNEIVVRDPETREALAGRARRVSEASAAERGARADGHAADPLVLAEALLDLGAREAAHWRALRRLA